MALYSFKVPFIQGADIAESLLDASYIKIHNLNTMVQQLSNNHASASMKQCIHALLSTDTSITIFLMRLALMTGSPISTGSLEIDS